MLSVRRKNLLKNAKGGSESARLLPKKKETVVASPLVCESSFTSNPTPFAGATTQDNNAGGIGAATSMNEDKLLDMDCSSQDSLKNAARQS